MSTTDSTTAALPAPIDMVCVEITPAGGPARLHGPLRRTVADRMVAGAQAASAAATVRALNDTPDELELLPIIFGQWPPTGFRPGEVASIYCDPTERTRLLMGGRWPHLPSHRRRSLDRFLRRKGEPL
jgi:hypothetical protein